MKSKNYIAFISNSGKVINKTSMNIFVTNNIRIFLFYKSLFYEYGTFINDLSGPRPISLIFFIQLFIAINIIKLNYLFLV